MLRFLISKGHNLCKNLEDYTFAQYYFMLLVDKKKYLDRKAIINAKNGVITISSGESKKSIKNKLRLLKR